jgi:hypothetical protein
MDSNAAAGLSIPSISIVVTMVASTHTQRQRFRRLRFGPERVPHSNQGYEANLVETHG